MGRYSDYLHHPEQQCPLESGHEAELRKEIADLQSRLESAKENNIELWEGIDANEDCLIELKERIALLEAELESIKPYVLLPGPMVPDLGRIALLEGLLREWLDTTFPNEATVNRTRKALDMEYDDLVSVIPPMGLTLIDEEDA